MLHSGRRVPDAAAARDHGAEARWRDVRPPALRRRPSAAATDAAVRADRSDAELRRRACARCSTRAPSTTPPCRRSSRSRPPARSSSPGSTTSWSAAPPATRPAATFLVGFDSLPIRAEKSLWDLAVWTRGRPQLVEALTPTPADVLVAGLGGPGTSGRRPGPRGVAAAVPGAPRPRTGTSSTTSTSPTRSRPTQPGPLIEALRFSLRRRRLRPVRAAAGSGGPAGARDRRRARAGSIRCAARAFRAAAGAGRSGCAPLREDALGDVGLAWPQLRRMLRELGRRLARRSRRTSSGCGRPSSSALADGRGPAARTRAETCERRREVWRGQRRVTPPQVLPERRLAAAAASTACSRPSRPSRAATCSPASARAPGRVTARARVLGGAADFAAFQPGEVLVAAITTPGVDVALPEGRGGRHRRRRTAQPQLDRGPGVRHPGRARHGQRHPAAPHRGPGHGRRRRRDRDQARSVSLRRS